MSRIIARKNPGVFRTQAIEIKASPEVLRYMPVGNPIGFAEMQALREPVEVENTDNFELVAANLGVSVDLSLNWQGRQFRVLIRQKRVDHGDSVLKLISGYVPAHELRVPLLPVMTELAEELLIEGSHGWLQGSYLDTWLPTPYAPLLPRCKRYSYKLTPRQCGTRPVLCRELHLVERPRAYLHLPTNSLQLVYAMQLELPENCADMTLLHADERLDANNGELIVEMDYQKPEIFLAEIQDGKATGELFSLVSGELQLRSPQNRFFSEALAEQHGWVVAAPRCEWNEGLQRL
ncbi:MAG: metal ABC transporter ATPase [Pseudomonas sp.]|nr:metal ABC transporter ATPase [Pseudomonas sp.]